MILYYIMINVQDDYPYEIECFFFTFCRIDETINASRECSIIFFIQYIWIILTKEGTFNDTVD